MCHRGTPNVRKHGNETDTSARFAATHPVARIPPCKSTISFPVLRVGQITERYGIQQKLWKIWGVKDRREGVL